MNTLGLRGIPVTLTGSLIILGAWMLTFFAMGMVGAVLPGGWLGTAIATGVALIAFGGSTLVSSIALRPLRRFFVTVHAPQRNSLVGKMCEITSLRVDARFGQGEIGDGGAGFIADVRCFKANELTRGDTALVFDYDKDNEVFHVMPVDNVLTESTDRKPSR